MIGWNISIDICMPVFPTQKGTIFSKGKQINKKMKQKILKVSTLLLFFFGLTSVMAQEALPASGGDASGTDGSVCYTIGQIVYTTNTGTTGIVAQGLQQPFEFSMVTGIEHTKDIIFNCSVYPNPTTDYIILKVGFTKLHKKQSMEYQLYDMYGKKIKSKQIEVSETIITMSNLISGIYCLRIVQGNTRVKAFKILKN